MLTAEGTILLFFAFFQCLVAVVLARRPGDRVPPRAMHALVALLLVNGGLALIEALRSEGIAAATLGRVGQVLDVPSGALIFAAALWLREGTARLVVGNVALGIALLHAVAVALFPHLGAGAYDVALRHVPYTAATLLLFAAVARERAPLWIGLAFVPRALYFATLVGVADLAAWPTSGASLALVATLGLGAGALVFTAYGLWSRDVPRSTIVVVGAVGPVNALAQLLAPGSPTALLAFLNFVTLGFVRPLVHLLGFSPAALPVVLGRAAAATAASVVLVAAGDAALAVPHPAVVLLGIALGALVLPAMETRVAPVAGPTRSADPPHWQRLVVALRGSSLGPPTLATTQQELARAVGIGIQRVSEFPDDLNTTAESKLDAFLPGWRQDHRGPVRLVETRRGAVAGAKGARVHYRLTPLGERLAEALERQIRVKIRADSRER